VAALDMGASKVTIPEADPVHDRRNVMKHLNEGVDTVRKPERAGLSYVSRDWLTGRKNLLLKNPSDWKAGEKQSLQELRRKDLKFTRAWGVRETFQSFWEFTSKTAARAFFDQWLQKGKERALRLITKVAVMLNDHFPGLLNYITHRVTNAITEGFNSKIQMIKSCARGSRSFKNYRVAILFHFGKLNLYP
jgi:transposase